MGSGATLLIRRRWAMNWLYVVGAVISVLLLIYLSVALLWPERFS
jgi:K+-transporting ATPase KdpF subunit